MRARRDLAETCLVRGFQFTHEAVRDREANNSLLWSPSNCAADDAAKWAALGTPMKPTSPKGHPVNGKWRYLYRAIDRDGNLVDSMLSEHRDMEPAGYLLGAFFSQAREVAGHKPTRVTTDGHDSYPRAIRRILGCKVEHRTNRLALIKLPQ